VSNFQVFDWQITIETASDAFNFGAQACKYGLSLFRVRKNIALALGYKASAYQAVYRFMTTRRVGDDMTGNLSLNYFT